MVYRTSSSLSHVFYFSSTVGAIVHINYLHRVMTRRDTIVRDGGDTACARFVVVYKVADVLRGSEMEGIDSTLLHWPLVDSPKSCPLEIWS